MPINVSWYPYSLIYVLPWSTFWRYTKDDWRINKDDAEKYRCEVFDRTLKDDGTHLYEVEVALPLDEDDDNSDPDDEDKFDFVTIKDVPQYGIQFVNKPYSSDVFLPNAFRHEMGIPDDMMPDAWKNAKL